MDEDIAGREGRNGRVVVVSVGDAHDAGAIGSGFLQIAQIWRRDACFERASGDGKQNPLGMEGSETEQLRRLGLQRLRREGWPRGDDPVKIMTVYPNHSGGEM